MEDTLWAIRVVVLLACCPRVLAAAEEKRAGDALALQRAVQEAIRKAEPSIACILVSRSSQYARFEKKVPHAVPGRLGGFDARVLKGARRPDSEHWRLVHSLDLADPDNVPESYGSGVVLDSSGLILTCAHVVHGATRVYVRLPGGAGSYADIHALDGRSDLAVLRLIDRLPGLKAVALGNAGQVARGQFVISLANPYAAGFRDGSPSASLGIVSNLRRRLPGLTTETERNRLSLHQFGTLIQTDARLALGCSGGALLDLEGDLVGVTTARAALTGVETPGGFAIPMNAGLRRIIEVLKRGEEVEYGFLGVKFRPNRGDGVQIAEVIGGSAASQAGLRSGDFIRSVGGMKVRRFDDVFLALGLQLSGSMVEVERSRRPDGPTEKVRATLGKYFLQLPSIASKQPPAWRGLRVDHTSLLVQRNNERHSIPEGVLIREVVSGSPADRAGLQPGRIITHVNGQPVSTPAEYYHIVKTARGKVELTLQGIEGRPERVTLPAE
jgi:serine protease Do